MSTHLKELEPVYSDDLHQNLSILIAELKDFDKGFPSIKFKLKENMLLWF